MTEMKVRFRRWLCKMTSHRWCVILDPEPTGPLIRCDRCGKEALYPINAALYPIAYVMSNEEQKAQRRSFVYGNCAIDNPNVTREMVDEVGDAIDAEKSEARDG